MTWLTAVADIRTLLSDGATDRYRYRTKCFGEVNGTNKLFKTFEFRRITNFTTASAPLGVYVNGVAVTATADYIDQGEFSLTAAPADGTVVEASFYVQWFTDAELSTFLRVATEWLGLGIDSTLVPSGLQPAAMQYAAGQSYVKMAMRWRERLSQMYRVEDMPDEKQSAVVADFMKMADSFETKARELRNDYYTRQGQNLQPLFATMRGCVRSAQPRG